MQQHAATKGAIALRSTPKIEGTVLDERGESHTWTDRPNLRKPDRYLKVGYDCDPTVDALNDYAGKYLRK